MTKIFAAGYRDRLERTISLFESQRTQLDQLNQSIAATKKLAREYQLLERHAAFEEGFARFDEFDWKTLLHNGHRIGSLAPMREALRICAPSGRWPLGSVWGDTNQFIITLTIIRDDPQSAKDWALFAERILRFIDPMVKERAKRFAINPTDGSATLVYLIDSGVWVVRAGGHYSERDVESFMNAEEACEFIRERYGNADKYDQFSPYYEGDN